MASEYYEFLSTDTTELEEYMISKYEEICGVTMNAASPERLFVAWVEDIILYLINKANYVGNQNLPSRASGENLDALGEVFFGTERPGETYATVTMRFYISEAQSSTVIIPAGTRVTDEDTTLYWATTEDAYVAIGDTYTDVEAQCQTAGADANDWAAGTINTCVDVFDYYTACENITVSDGGSDEYTDDEYYGLLQLALSTRSTAGPYSSYEYWASSVSSEIGAVLINSPSPGYVYIYVLMSDGTTASDEIKEAVYEACNADDVRPLTDNVVVADPSFVSYDIDVTYYLLEDSDLSAATVAANVEAAVEEFVEWQAGKIGRDINPSKLIQLMMQTGIKRVEVTSPVYTVLQDGILEESVTYDLEDTVPQVAQIGTITITNGGTEIE